MKRLENVIFTEIAVIMTMFITAVAMLIPSLTTGEYIIVNERILEMLEVGLAVTVTSLVLTSWLYMICVIGELKEA